MGKIIVNVSKDITKMIIIYAKNVFTPVKLVGKLMNVIHV